MRQQPSRPTLFPYTTLFRSNAEEGSDQRGSHLVSNLFRRSAQSTHRDNNAKNRRYDAEAWEDRLDRKSTRLNSSHSQISYAVFCLKKKKIIPAWITLNSI